ncbi:SDR family NAD(P)-dependent oxidoreductase [Piscinibacter sakaiensis]|nr:SDR family NAD(P)-dependent oxidoreductase [Piscinibacter sakaiensis]
MTTTGRSTGPRDLRDHIVLVTGAASGMGAATARAFVEAGACVALTDLDAEGVRAAAQRLQGGGPGRAEAWTLDVTDAAAIIDVVAQVAARFGGIDALVNNAGVTTLSPIDAPEYEERWTRALGVLLTSQQRMIRAVLPHLRASRAPRIVNIASTEALGGTRNNSAYAAAKSGVIGLTRALAVELGREAITVNCICPGPIETAMTARIPAEHKQTFARQRTALGRYGSAEEVAHMVLSLCMPGASYVTGAVIPVDGGLVARNG